VTHVESMRELVDIAVFERLLQAIAIAGPVVGALSGLILGVRRRAPAAGLVKGIALGALGPVLFALWRLYSYLVRYDPATGYVGLHRVDVLLLNVLIFVAIGAVLGIAYARLFRAGAVENTQSDNTKKGDGSCEPPTNPKGS